MSYFSEFTTTTRSRRPRFNNPLRSNLFSDLRSPASFMSDMPTNASDLVTEVKTTTSRLLPSDDVSFPKNLKPAGRKRMSVMMKKDRKHTDNIINYVCETGDLSFLTEMHDLGADLTARNEEGKTPLLTACEYGQTEVVKRILDWLVLKPKDSPNNNPPIEEEKISFTEDLSAQESTTDPSQDHTAGCFDHFYSYMKCKKQPDGYDSGSSLHFMENKSYDLNSPLYNTDNQGKNCLYLAAANSQRDVVFVLLELGFSYVRPLLESCIVVTDKKSGIKYHDSCLRMIMRKMPDVCNRILDKYIDRSNEENSIWDCYYTLLDDTSIQNCDNKTCDCKNKIEARSYARDNHPLMLAYSGEKIVNHHLVTSLLYLKWRRVRPVHFMMLFWYFTFMMLITSYMLISTTKFQPPMSNNTLANGKQGVVVEKKPLYQYSLGIIIAAMSVVGIGIEIVQLIVMRSLYFEKLGQIVQNALDWIMYVEAIYVVTFPPDGFRTLAQWEIGACCMIAVWFNFLLHHPVFCNYLLMVIEVLVDLWRFTFVFIMFLLMFGLTFFVILSNQASHGTVFGSVIRTWTMMLGDIGYGDMFHPDDEVAHVRYEPVAYGIFILFLLLGLIITNMWTGFIIDRLSSVEQMATIRKLQMQLDFILTLENFLPNCMMRCFVFRKPSHRFQLGLHHRPIMYVLSTLLGDMKFSMPTLDDILSANKLKHTSADKAEAMIKNFKSMLDNVNNESGNVAGNGVVEDKIEPVNATAIESAPSLLQ